MAFRNMDFPPALQVGDSVFRSKTAGPVVRSHFTFGNPYKVAKVTRDETGGCFFFTEGGRCEDLSCLCNARGWDLTYEFKVVHGISEEEAARAVDLPSPDDVARFLKIVVKP